MEIASKIFNNHDILENRQVKKIVRVIVATPSRISKLPEEKGAKMLKRRRIRKGPFTEGLMFLLQRDRPLEQ